MTIPNTSCKVYLLYLFALLASATTVFVDNTGPNGSGSQTSPFSTLTYALNASQSSTSTINTIILTSCQTYNDLAQTFSYTTNLTITTTTLYSPNPLSSSATTIILSNNAQLIFSGAVLTIQNITLLFTDSTVTSFCVLQLSNQAQFLLNQTTIQVNTSSLQTNSLICANNASTIMIGSGCMISNVTTAQDSPLIILQNLSSLTMDNVALWNVTTLSEVGSVVSANETSAIIFNSTSFSSMSVLGYGLNIEDSEVTFDNFSILALTLEGSVPFVALISNSWQSNFTFTGSQVINLTSSLSSPSSSGSPGNINEPSPVLFSSAGILPSNIRFSNVAFTNVTLPGGGIASIRGLGSQFTLTEVVMIQINVGLWYQIDSALIVNVSNSQFGNLSSEQGSVFLLNNVYSINFTSCIFNGIYADQRPAALTVTSTNATLNAWTSKFSPLQITRLFLVQNCSFQNNYGLYPNILYLGGTVFLETETPAQFINSTFQNNSLQFLGIQGKGLGAPCIFVQSFYAQLTISSSQFLNNRARYFSNCIWVYLSSVSIESSFLFNNTSIIDTSQGDDPVYGSDIGAGGAFLGAAENLVFRNSTFQQNLRNYGGDIAIITDDIADSIFTNGRNYLVDGCTFIGSLGLNGGNFAIEPLENTTVTIQNSLFEGLIYINGGVVLSQLANGSTLYMINNTIQNFSGEFGALFTQVNPNGDIPQIEITNCSIINISNSLGGAVINLVTSVTMTLRNLYLQNITELFHGSFINAKGGQITVDNCSLVGGVSIIGTIYLSSNVIMNISNCHFFNLEAVYDGGLFYLEKTSQLYAENITAQNIASSVSGSIATITQNSTATLVNIYLTGVSGVTGAALYIDQNSTTTFQNLQVQELASEVSAVYISNSTATFTNSTIQNAFGGSLFVITTSTFTLVNVSLENIQCGIQASTCGILITSSNFVQLIQLNVQNLSTEGDSGVLSLNQSSVTIEESIFRAVNSSNHAGCALIAYSSIVIKSSIFSNLIGGCLASQEGGNNIKISDSIFSQEFNSTILNSGLQRSFIECQDFVNCQIFNSSFSNNYVSGSGGAISISNSDSSNPSYLMVGNGSSFTSNSVAQNGGAIAITNTISTMTDVAFFNNSAVQSGGSLYHNSSQKNDIYISQSNFTNNSAGISGGAIFIEDTMALLDVGTVVMSGNNAGYYGNNQASNAVRLTLQMINTTTQAIIFNQLDSLSSPSLVDLQSGQPVTSNLSFQAIDQFNQSVTSLTNTMVSIALQRVNQANPNLIQPSIASIKDFFLTQGHFSIDDLTFYSMTPDSLELIVSIPSGAFSGPTGFTYNTYESYSNYTYYFIISLQVRDCVIGEAKVSTPQKQYCMFCSSGSYSFDPSNGTCLKCPDSAICYGGANTSIKAGYWRPSNLSMEIYSCLIDEVCPEGTGYDCQSGYSGPLCQTCSTKYTAITALTTSPEEQQKQQQFFMLGGSECFTCLTDSASSPMFLFIAAAYLLFFALNIWINFRAETDQSLQIQGYLKVLNGYFQLTSIAINGEFSWPSQITRLFNLLSVGDVSTSTSVFDCLLSQSSSYPPEYKKMIITSLFPLFFGCISVVVLLICKCVRRKLEIRTKMNIAFVTIFYLLVPGITKQLLRGLTCVDINDNLKFNKAFLFECNESRYTGVKFGLILPLFLVWCVIVPCWLFLTTNNKRRLYLLNSPKFVVQPYKEQYQDWDAIIFIRNFALCLSSVFISLDFYNKSLLNFFLLSIYFYLTESFRPFKCSQLNLFECYNVGLSCLICLVSVYFETITTPDGSSYNIVFFLFVFTECSFVLGFVSSFLIFEVKSLNKAKNTKDTNTIDPPKAINPLGATKIEEKKSHSSLAQDLDNSKIFNVTKNLLISEQSTTKNDLEQLDEQKTHSQKTKETSTISLQTMDSKPKITLSKHDTNLLDEFLRKEEKPDELSFF